MVHPDLLTCPVSICLSYLSEGRVDQGIDMSVRFLTTHKDVILELRHGGAQTGRRDLSKPYCMNNKDPLPLIKKAHAVTTLEKVDLFVILFR